MKLNRRCIALTVFLLAVVGSSVALNLFLYHRGRQYYLQLNETRLDPLGLSYYDTDSSLVSYTNSDQMRAVFYGDSRAANWPPPDLEGFEFINRGVGSQTSVQAAYRFGSHVRPLQPEVVVVQVGINDLKTIPLFPWRREAIVANCQENIRRIVEEATAQGTRVILSTIFPVGEVPLVRRPFWSDEVALAVDEVNDYLQALGSEQVLVFDSFAVLADEEGVLRREYRQDELHLNEMGYEALNKGLVKMLASLDR